MINFDDPLDFVRNGLTGTVHVVASSSGGGCDPDRAWPSGATSEYEELGPAWLLATCPALALCGWIGKTAHGFDDEYTDCFRDEDLCRKCCAALGDHSHLAFEHEQP